MALPYQPLMSIACIARGILAWGLGGCRRFRGAGGPLQVAESRIQ